MLIDIYGYMTKHNRPILAIDLESLAKTLSRYAAHHVDDAVFITWITRLVFIKFSIKVNPLAKPSKRLKTTGVEKIKFVAVVVGFRVLAFEICRLALLVAADVGALEVEDWIYGDCVDVARKLEEVVLKKMSAQPFCRAERFFFYWQRLVRRYQDWFHSREWRVLRLVGGNIRLHVEVVHTSQWLKIPLLCLCRECCQEQ